MSINLIFSLMYIAEGSKKSGFGLVHCDVELQLPKSCTIDAESYWFLGAQTTLSSSPKSSITANSGLCAKNIKKLIDQPNSSADKLGHLTFSLTVSINCYYGFESHCFDLSSLLGSFSPLDATTCPYEEWRSINALIMHVGIGLN